MFDFKCRILLEELDMDGEFRAGKILVGIWTLSAVCALRLCHRHVRLGLASATFPIQKERGARIHLLS